MLTLDVLPARYGDALLLTYGKPRYEHRILIDGGFSSTGEEIARTVRDLARPIDLVVVSHIDKDHIAGIVKLLGEDGIKDRINGVWFNGYKHIEQYADLLGPVDGERLTTKLVELGINWNVGWDWADDVVPPAHVGGPVVVEDRPVRKALPAGAQAIVLSPTPQKLGDLIPKWKPVVAGADLDPQGAVEDETDDQTQADDESSDILGQTIKELADADSDEDTTPANGSSIAFVFQYRNGNRLRRILLAGDAHPDVLTASIERLRGSKYRLDAFKLPHHGSKANVTADLVRSVDCPSWIVSSNGVSHDHPNPQALARIVEYGGTCPTIVCNYTDNAPLNAFIADHPPDWNDYRVETPDDGEGIQMTF